MNGVTLIQIRTVLNDYVSSDVDVEKKFKLMYGDKITYEEVNNLIKSRSGCQIRG